MFHILTHLHQRPLNLSIRASSLAETSSTNSIDLVHEDDTWFVFFGVGEHFSDQSSRLSDVFVDDLGSAELEFGTYS